MSKDRAEKMESIKITPTWAFAMRIYIDVLENSENESAKQAARDDLMRLAESVDKRDSQ